MSSFDALIAEHRRHYEPGTLERFQSWFAQSGYSDMLDSPWLREGHKRKVALQGHNLHLSSLKGIEFLNKSARPWRIGFTPTIQSGVNSLDQLFRNFVRSTAHTHVIGDFRKNLGYFLNVFSGSRFFLFDGAGTCLLFGAMFQALAGRVLGEIVNLHYSHSANCELTHVFGTWRNEYFVDPDQKTFVRLDEIDRSAVFGYLFQQFGVSAHQIYRAINPLERESLFAKMTRDYFEFYEGSVGQYMYQRKQDTNDVSRFFLEARERYCSALSVDASDFPWKSELRRVASEQSIERPYFLINCDRTIPIDVPPDGALEIGLDQQDLPEEARLLSTLFLGRVPGALSVPFVEGRCRVTLAEFPWLMVFEPEISSISIDGVAIPTRRSRCGRYRIVGMGQFESFFDLTSGREEFSVEVKAPGATRAKFVLPFNAFALGAGLVRIDAPEGLGRAIYGSMVP